MDRQVELPLRPASSLEPHHSVEVIYPSSSLLGTLFLLPIDRASERFEPLPLLPGADCHDAFRASKEQVRFQSVVPTERVTDKRGLRCSHGHDKHSENHDVSTPGGFEALRTDMELVCFVWGDTRLEVLTHEIKAGDFDDDSLCYTKQAGRKFLQATVLRTTKVVTKDNAMFTCTPRLECTAKYSGSLADLCVMLVSLEKCSPWAADLLDLIHRRSDRAVLHVQCAEATRHGKLETTKDASADWKDLRYPPYEQEIGAFVRDFSDYEISKLNVNIVSCQVCHSQCYAGQSYAAFVKIKCRGEHSIHRQCLLLECKKNGPDKVCCLECGDLLFTTSAVVDKLRFGVEGKSYIHDSRFDAWENFQRSCIDLDMTRSEIREDRVLCNAELLEGILNKLIKGELADHPCGVSSPRHNPVNRPELAKLQYAIKGYLSRTDPVDRSARDLHCSLTHAVESAFLQEYRDSKMWDTLRETEQTKLIAGDAENFENYIMPPGFWDFTMMLISRMVAFLIRRACDCGAGKWHYHGRRAYFKAAAFRTKPLWMFDRHHMTTFQFPCAELLDEARETLFLPQVSGCALRAEPLPLIPDTAVQAHAYRDSLEETSYYMINTVNSCKAALCPDPPGFAGLELSLSQLVIDMHKPCSIRGVTELRIVIYLPHGETKPRLRIKRFVQHHGESALERRSYVYGADLDSFLQGKWHPLMWRIMVLDLILRRTDRAVLHVRAMLESQQVTEPETTWGVVRHLDYTEALEGRFREVDICDLALSSNGELVCAICTADEDPETLVALACSQRHIFHPDCILTWCEGSIPDEATCPLCRAQILKESPLLNFLKYGISPTGYEYDWQYTAWENYERSFADLDKELAENSSTMVACNRKLTKDILSNFRHQELHFGHAMVCSRATSSHFLEMNFPECSVLDESILTTIGSLRGRIIPAKKLFEIYVQRVHLDFWKLFMRKGLYDDLSAAVIKKCSLQVSAAIRDVTMRPGFQEYIMRLLNRLVRFQILRACACTESGVHVHGKCKYYYNAAMYGLGTKEVEGSPKQKK